MSSVLLAAVIVLNTVPSVFAVGTLSIAFNVAGASNFPAGTNIPFTIDTTPMTNSTNTLNDGAFPDGTFTLTATLPANTQIGAGAGYNVTGTNTLSFTMTSGATLNLTINITNTVVAPAISTLSVAFSVAGASNFPAGTNIPFNINTTPVTNSTNTLNDGAFPVGTFTLTATLPANTQIGAGANYNVTGTTTATFTTTASGTLNLTINIVNTAGAPGGGTSTLSIGFNTAAATNFPVGTNIPFAISTTPITNSTNTLNDGAFPVGTFTLTATLPANTQIGAGANYTVTGGTTLTFTTTTGGTLNLTINIVNTAGGPGAGTSALTIGFNTAGSSNFPVGTNIPFAISTTPVTNSTNTLNDGAFPAGTFTLTATLPANTQIGAGTNYNVTGGTTLTFTTTAGGTLNLTINIVNTGVGPGPGGNGTLNIAFATPATFPVGTNIPFTINTVPVTNGTNTLTNASIAAGNYTLTATLPQGFEIVTGANYGVPSITTAIFTIVSGATLNLNIQIVAAGNSGRPRGNVSITFTDENNQTITSKSITIGQATTVTVTGIDSRGGNVNLSLSQDPSSTKTSKAVFTVPAQGLLTTVGTFTWAPSADSLGTNQFVFTGTNGTTLPTDAVLTINVTTNITNGGGGNGGSGGSGGGGGGGFRTPDLIIDNSEKFEKCRFKDNQTESVIYLCMLGIIDQPTMDKDFGGKSKNMQYFGKDPITRAAFTKIMINITYDESDIEKVAKLVLANNYFPFPDVEPIAWFAKYIAVGQLDNHIHGYPHLGLFIPWNDIEVSEAVKILFNTARHDNKKIAADLDQAVIDAGSEPWFMRFALLAYAYGGYTPVLDKDPGMIYSQKLNRQQAADIIYTTILNAGLETKGKLSALKQELMDLQESVQPATETEATI